MRHSVVGLGLAMWGGLAMAAEAPGSRLDDLAWMAGSWASKDGGKLSEEHWTGAAGGMMLGVHRDLEGGKAAFEFLRIEERDGKVTYLASPQGRPATPFELIENGALASAPQRAVFANPDHDFPQRILYWREGESLCAAVEGPIDGETVSERWCWSKSSLK
jgi:hypothetical protein